MHRKIFTVAEQRRIDRMVQSGLYTRLQIADTLGVDPKTLRNHMVVTTGEVATPGRPPKLTSGSPFTVYLDTETVNAARAIGDGNLSNGLRTAVKIASDTSKQK